MTRMSGLRILCGLRSVTVPVLSITVRSIKQQHTIHERQLLRAVTTSNPTPNKHRSQTFSTNSTAEEFSTEVSDNRLASPSFPLPPEGCINKVVAGVSSPVPTYELYRHLRTMAAEDVLETFAAGYAGMDKLHCAACMKRLLAVHSRLWGATRTDYVDGLHRDARFQILLAVLTRHAPGLDASVTSDLLHSLLSLGLHGDHPAVRTLVTLTRHQLNDLSLGQLIQTAWGVRGIAGSTAGVVSEGIRTLVRHRTHELRSLTLDHNLMLLGMFAGELTERWQGIVLDNIRADISERFGPQRTLLLLRALGKVGARELEEFVVSSVERHLDTFNPHELREVVSALMDAKLYTPELLDEIGHMMSLDRADWLPDPLVITPEDKLELLKIFSRMSHVHEELMENVLSELDNGRLRIDNSLSVLGIMASTGHLPRHFSDDVTHVFTGLLQKCIDSVNLQNSTSDDTLDLLTVCLSCDVQPPPELSSRLTPHNNQSEASSVYTPTEHGGYSLARSEYIRVLQILTDNTGPAEHQHRAGQDMAGCNPASPVCAPEGPMAGPRVPGLQSCVQLALLSGASVQHSVTLAGLHVDHVIEEGKKPRMVVKVFPASAFTRNQWRLKAVPRLYLAALGQLGYRTLGINPTSWAAIPEKERHLYLRAKLRRLHSRDVHTTII